MNISDLSETAKKLLRHFRDVDLKQHVFEYAGNMEALFSDAEKCEAAQAELARLNILELSPEPPGHQSAKNKIRSAALTHEGERYLQTIDLG